MFNPEKFERKYQRLSTKEKIEQHREEIVAIEKEELLKNMIRKEYVDEGWLAIQSAVRQRLNTLPEVVVDEIIKCEGDRDKIIAVLRDEIEDIMTKEFMKFNSKELAEKVAEQTRLQAHRKRLRK